VPLKQERPPPAVIAPTWGAQVQSLPMLMRIDAQLAAADCVQLHALQVCAPW
jgi:hypothetical protein